MVCCGLIQIPVFLFLLVADEPITKLLQYVLLEVSLDVDGLKDELKHQAKIATLNKVPSRVERLKPC